MAKTKKSKQGHINKKKQGYKDPAGWKKQQEHKKPDNKAEVKIDNPFEIRANKRKHETLGRVAKHETGNPGISRSKAIEKRKATLLKEYKVRNKTNLLVDKRIGEKNRGLTEEDKVNKRVALERSRQYKKKSIFNLPDEDNFKFTHKGETLHNFDRYDDPRESDSEDEKLNDDFVSDANFSGFLKIKSGEEAEKSREERISEIILESKKRKFEKAKAKDENYEVVNDLDATFKSSEFKKAFMLLNLPKKPKFSLEALAAEKEKEKEPKPSNEDKDKEPTITIKTNTNTTTTEPKEPKVEISEYDKLVRELKFAPTPSGKASDADKKDKDDEWSSEKQLETAQTTLEKLTIFQSEFSKKKIVNEPLLLFWKLTKGYFEFETFSNAIKSCASLFLGQILSQGKIQNISHFINILCICDIQYEISKSLNTYTPETMNFLSTALLCFCDKKSKLANLTLAKKFQEAREMLLISNKLKLSEVTLNTDIWEIKPPKMSDEDEDKIKLEILGIILHLIEKFFNIYNNLPSSQEIFNPIKVHLNELQTNDENWPNIILENIKDLTSSIDTLNKKEKEVLKINADKPKPLKLYEPVFEEEFDGRKKKKLGRQKQEQERLKHKVKQEMKSAVREIKKDNVFLAKQQLKEQIQKDTERKRKVKDLMSSLANQEGEYKKFKKE